MSLGRLKMKSSLIRRSKTRPVERDGPAIKAGSSSTDDNRQNASWPVTGSPASTSSLDSAELTNSSSSQRVMAGPVVGGATGNSAPVTTTSQWKSRKSVGGTILKSIRRKLPWNRHGSTARSNADTSSSLTPDTTERGIGTASGAPWFGLDSNSASSTTTTTNNSSPGNPQRIAKALRLVDSPPPHSSRGARIQEEEDRDTDDEQVERIDTHSPEVDLCPPEVASSGAADDGCYMNLESVQTASLTAKLRQLPQNGWYWGPLTRAEAEEKLAEQPDGAFLVRDSSDHHYLLSLSFRSFGKTLHTRIEHRNGVFSFYAQSLSEGHPSIVDLIEHSVNYSQSGVFCYSRARGTGAPSYPVRLTRPLSRFTRVRSLQYLCRFVIRQNTSVDAIRQLPLPKPIKGFVEEGYY